MHPNCCNGGGKSSCLRLPFVPAAEERVRLGGTVEEGLAAWRARRGEILTFVDPQQRAWRTRLEERDGAWWAIPFECLSGNPESRIEIDLFQALPQRERFELVLEKATELGATRIVPYHSERSITLEERDARQRKSHRWPELVLRAARQCRRPQLPELYPVCEWNQALYLASRADLKLMLYEGRCAWSLGEVAAGEGARRVSVLVGPEGGFSASEVEEARQTGFLPVGLGPRLLRTETAAIAAVAVLQAYLGDF